MDPLSSKAALERGREKRGGTHDTAISALGMHEADVHPLLPSGRTWLDNSPLPLKHQFFFPNNRSSASTAPPNGSASPLKAAPVTQQVEGGAGTDAMRKELIRLYDSNAELREQVERLQACLRNRKMMLANECEWNCSMRFAELREALRAERLRCEENEKIIAALREELSAANQAIAFLSRTQKVPLKESGGTRFQERLLNGWDRSSSLVTQDDPQMVLEEEMAALQARLHREKEEQQQGNQSGNGCLLERQIEAENFSWSRDHSVIFPTPNSSFGAGNDDGKRTAVTGTNNCQRHTTPPTLATLDASEQTSTLLKRMARTPPASSSRVFVPQTLADINAVAVATPFKTEAEPWYDEEEVKEVVSFSRASRLRVAMSPRCLLRPSHVNKLSQ
ncbi:hypothetical protein MOQ_008519 [Trypanosoma cruzi marinkellei]|uniref:Uncharacterized protein n=1 Tax=Trypanosoma cruzi marinkellei TaxID=85056 RepID=K2NFG3_TRYCR|nr:hypothetical protein MOQ_008519 [Trypanosoma cruzi marinkellei]